MKEKYIKKETVISIFNAKADMAIGSPKAFFHSMAKMVELLPSADVAAVRHGHWKLKGVLIKATGAKNYPCSECRCDGFHTNFCPKCGAKMDAAPGKENER